MRLGFSWNDAPLWAVAVAVAAVGCDVLAFADRNQIPAASGGGGHGGAATTSHATGGSGGAAATTSASSGGDAGGGCILPIDCPGTDTDCLRRTCVDHHCGVGPADTGTPTSEQLAGDCKRQVCDGKGGVQLTHDDTDVPVDGNPCTHDACDGGVPSNPPAPSDTACDAGGAVCDGVGHCVECVNAGECATGACVNNVCVAATCADGTKDGSETDTDCGGPSCPHCAAGKKCFAGSDCASGVCTAGACAAGP